MTSVQPFHGFIGQRTNVQLIKRHAAGCKACARSFPHTLLMGTSGQGKTELAKAMAAELETTIRVYVVDPDFSFESIAGDIRSFEMIFLDEAQALNRASQETLFGVIDSTSLGAESVKPGAKTWPACTIILATDQPGRLLNALIKRIPLQIHLLPYTETEMIDIIAKRASASNLVLTGQARRALAQCSQGNPRIARHHIQRLLTYCGVAESHRVESATLVSYLADHGYDLHFRDGPQRLYLQLLSNLGGTASIETMATQLGIDTAHLERHVEPYLLLQGWVTKSSRGRTLTPAGTESLNPTNPEPKE